MRWTILLLIGVLILLSGCAEEKREVKIGVMIPETGLYSKSGAAMKNAAELAAKHAKEVFGVDVKLVFADCGDTPEKAKSAFTYLASQGVVAVVGAYSSPQSIVAADAAKDAGIVYLASVASTMALEKKVAEGNRYVFRNSYNTTYWGVLAAEFLKIVGAKSYYFVGYDPLRTFNSGMLETIRSRTNAELAGVTYYKSPSVAPDDYKSVAAKVAKLSVDVVILGDPGPTSVSFVREYAKNGGKAIVYSVGGVLALPHVLKRLNIDNIAFQAAALEEVEKTELTKRYFEDYRKTYGEEANNYAGILTYDAVLIIAQAAKKGELIENLEKGSFVGAAGVYSFNENHQAAWGSEKLKGTIGIYRNGSIEVLYP